MKNNIFDISVDVETGCLTSICRTDDRYEMNWCASDGCWGKVHGRNTELISCVSDEARSESIYSDGKLQISVTRTFLENGNVREHWVVQNLTDTVVCINRDNFGVELPFNDRYTNADECMIHHCHAHIWCGHHITWVNALKMGDSDCNLGLVLTEGAMDCYSQLGCKSNHRGIFVFHPESVMLNAGASYTFAWELFGHTGTEDFMEKLSLYPHMITVTALDCQP